jgi:hypothetical protein
MGKQTRAGTYVPTFWQNLLCTDVLTKPAMYRRFDKTCYVPTFWENLLCTDVLTEPAMYRRFEKTCYVPTFWENLLCTDVLTKPAMYRRFDKTCYVPTFWQNLLCTDVLTKPAPFSSVLVFFTMVMVMGCLRSKVPQPPRGSSDQMLVCSSADTWRWCLEACCCKRAAIRFDSVAHLKDAVLHVFVPRPLSAVMMMADGPLLLLSSGSRTWLIKEPLWLFRWVLDAVRGVYLRLVLGDGVGGVLLVCCLAMHSP